MNTAWIMEAANIFCGDVDPTKSNHLLVMNVKLPSLEENYVDHTAGGAPLGIEIPTHINKLLVNFSLVGWQPYVMTMIGTEVQAKQQFTIYGLIRDRRTSRAIQAKAVVEGRLGKADPTEFNKGAAQSFQYDIRALTHYELYVDDLEIYFWDFFNSVRRIGGEDFNADLNRMLAIPVAA
jgi:Bacteriophage tail tube protein